MSLASVTLPVFVSPSTTLFSGSSLRSAVSRTSLWNGISESLCVCEGEVMIMPWLLFLSPQATSNGLGLAVLVPNSQ